MALTKLEVKCAPKCASLVSGTDISEKLQVDGNMNDVLILDASDFSDSDVDEPRNCGNSINKAMLNSPKTLSLNCTTPAGTNGLISEKRNRKETNKDDAVTSCDDDSDSSVDTDNEASCVASPVSPMDSSLTFRWQLDRSWEPVTFGSPAKHSTSSNNLSKSPNSNICKSDNTITPGVDDRLQQIVQDLREGDDEVADEYSSISFESPHSYDGFSSCSLDVNFFRDDFGSPGGETTEDGEIKDDDEDGEIKEDDEDVGRVLSSGLVLGPSSRPTSSSSSNPYSRDLSPHPNDRITSMADFAESSTANCHVSPTDFYFGTTRCNAPDCFGDLNHQGSVEDVPKTAGNHILSSGLVLGPSCQRPGSSASDVDSRPSSSIVIEHRRGIVKSSKLPTPPSSRSPILTTTPGLVDETRQLPHAQKSPGTSEQVVLETNDESENSGHFHHISTDLTTSPSSIEHQPPSPPLNSSAIKKTDLSPVVESIMTPIAPKSSDCNEHDHRPVTSSPNTVDFAVPLHTTVNSASEQCDDGQLATPLLAETAISPTEARNACHSGSGGGDRPAPCHHPCCSDVGAPCHNFYEEVAKRIALYEESMERVIQDDLAFSDEMNFPDSDNPDDSLDMTDDNTNYLYDQMDDDVERMLYDDDDDIGSDKPEVSSVSDRGLPCFNGPNQHDSLLDYTDQAPIRPVDDRSRPSSPVTPAATAAPANRERFVSDDPAENQDNDNIGWKVLEQLKTDDERYRCVRLRWRSLQIPDSNISLQRQTFRKRRIDPKNQAGTVTSDEPYRGGKRPADEPSPATKRQRTQSNVTMRDVVKRRIECATRRYDRMVQAAEEMLLEQKNHAQRLLAEDMRDVEGKYLTHLQRQDVDKNILVRNQQYRRQIVAKHRQHMENLRNDRYMAISKLNGSIAELNKFEAFYSGLKNSTTDVKNGKTLAVYQVAQTEEMDQMFELYDHFYGR